jgi:hypothetical protein
LVLVKDTTVFNKWKNPLQRRKHTTLVEGNPIAHHIISKG